MNAENAAALREKRCRKGASGKGLRSRSAALEQLIEIEAGAGALHILEQCGVVVLQVVHERDNRCRRAGPLPERVDHQCRSAAGTFRCERDPVVRVSKIVGAPLQSRQSLAEPAPYALKLTIGAERMFRGRPLTPID